MIRRQFSGIVGGVHCESEAQFSDDLKYRYSLSRKWSAGVGNTPDQSLVFCMLNPSTADEVDNDPTVERCQRRAAALGYSGVIVVNLFALRSTDPALLYGPGDHVGGIDGNAAITTAVITGNLNRSVVCAWGNHGVVGGRDRQVYRWLDEIGARISCLGVNKNQTPKHPLYVSYAVGLVPYKPVFAQ